MLGYTHESFWDQTPRTLSLTFTAYNKRLTNEHNERAWLAWHIGALQRVKKFPDLRTLLAQQKEAPQETLEQQLEGLKHWVQATGGKIIYKQ